MLRLFLAILAICAGASAATKPNILVILVDDMGFSDVGCYGSEIPTPNLDALAKNGLRFTQFYNTGRCCPTRAALLTGVYSHQAGVGHMVNNQKAPGYVGHLNDSCVTMAEVLRPAGYFTAMSGKWHVGFEQGVTPKTRGFDRSLCAAAGGFCGELMRGGECGHPPRRGGVGCWRRRTSGTAGPASWPPTAAQQPWMDWLGGGSRRRACRRAWSNAPRIERSPV